MIHTCIHFVIIFYLRERERERERLCFTLPWKKFKKVRLLTSYESLELILILSGQTHLHVLGGDISHAAVFQGPGPPPLGIIFMTVKYFKSVTFIKAQNVFRALALGRVKGRHCIIQLHSLHGRAFTC